MSQKGSNMRGAPQQNKLMIRTSSLDWAQVEQSVSSDKRGRDQSPSSLRYDPSLSGSRQHTDKQILSRTTSYPLTSSKTSKREENNTFDNYPIKPSTFYGNEYRKHSKSVSCQSDRAFRKQQLRKALSDSSSITTVEKVADEKDSDSKTDQNQHHIDTPKVMLDYTRDTASACGVSFSCPNLVDSKTVMKIGLENSRSSEMVNKSTPESRLGGLSSNVLKVPNIFVTSFTHSTEKLSKNVSSHNSNTTRPTGNLKKTPVLKAGHEARHNYRHSAPELSRNHLSPTRSYWDRLRETIKPTLKKSLSDCPTSLTKDFLNESHLKTTQCRKPSGEPRIVKILSYLFLGNIEASYNERLLCQLGVRSIIDLSNMTPEEIDGFRKISVPCMCVYEENHLKATLRMGLCEQALEDMDSSFGQINKFIEGAKNVSKKVLVVCWSGTSDSAFAVMQYLMTHKGYNFRRAYSMVMRQGSKVELSSKYQDILLTLERRLSPDPDARRLSSSDSIPDNPDITRLPREAWATYESET